MFGKKVKTENGLYGIIGLGRFGYALAQTLSESGKDLIIIDENEAKINSAAAFTDHAYVVQELSKENFRKVGIDNCDVVIICIGERIDTCILATLNVI
ncbi:MAG: NAD-binding protein, partial [Ruminococcus sp.]|nr:NAD-binding protein [Ruminococcus sp.]